MRGLEVRLEAISRRFGTMIANDRVDLALRPASIHAIVGENGAGKSTLMRILYGLLRPDSGRILIDGRPVDLSSPAQALARGIGMIHQHFMLVPVMTVLENVALGAAGMRGLRSIPRQRLGLDLKRLFETYGFDLDPGARIESLGVGGRQRVEIARMLYRGARLLICDEPTAVLAPPEVLSLFRILRRLRDEGRTVVFITHKLAEVMEIADRVTVLRRGRVVGEAEGSRIDRDRLVRWIVGEDRGEMPAQAAMAADDEAWPPGGRAADAGATPAMEGRALTILARDGRPLLRESSFALRRGEILGVAGVSGNGQRELAEVVSGLRPFSAGRLWIGGQRFGPGQRIPHRLLPALIPEDRTSEGLIGTFRLWENLLLGRTGELSFMRSGWYAHRHARNWATPLLQRFRVMPSKADLPANALSGGNQQKLLCAREISRGRKVLVACQPTRGVDLASTEFLHEMLRRLRARGGSILLFSADLDEILALSDRVTVIFRGKLGAAVARGQLDAESVGRRMVGADA